MTEFFSQPDDSGPARASEAETSLFGRIGAQAADTLDPKNSLSGMYIARRAREANAGGDDLAVGAGGDLDVFSGQSLQERQSVIDATRAAIPDVSQSDAKQMLKQEGLSESDVRLGDALTHKLPVLKLRMDEAHERRDRQAAIERGPQGFFPGALGFVTSLGVGMIDPVNVAAFSIPVIGEAKMGMILASAGDSILARGAARAGQGAAQGAVGTAVLQPADWWLHTQDGQDYTLAQAMESVIMGAGMGGAFHALPGALRDWRARRQGMPLEGSPTEQVLQALNPIEARREPAGGPDVLRPREEEVPGIDRGERPAEPPLRMEAIHPAEVLADLPPAVREDAIHAAMADIINDRPVRSAEMLDIAADHDPRIAESVRPWNEMGDEARGVDVATSSRADRRSSPAEAAADPRWRELGEARPEYNDPEVLAESEAAERAPEPDSVTPERSLSALEKAAADAEEVWRQVEPTLTDSERATVKDVMDQMQNDRKAREQIIADGAACLAAAVA